MYIQKGSRNEYIAIPLFLVTIDQITFVKILITYGNS